MDKVNDFKLAVTAVVALLTSLWGWFGWLVVLFVGCMAVDYLTGTAAAMHRGEWSSKSARDGIFHKIGSVIVVMVAGAADLLIGAMLGTCRASCCRLSIRHCCARWWSCGTRSRSWAQSSKMQLTWAHPCHSGSRRCCPQQRTQWIN